MIVMLLEMMMCIPPFNLNRSIEVSALPILILCQCTDAISLHIYDTRYAHKIQITESVRFINDNDILDLMLWVCFVFSAG